MNDSYYIKYPEIKNILGYVVNIYNAINFDIDLYLTPDQEQRYSNVVKNEYEFTDEDSDEPKIRTTYRCRMKDVSPYNYYGLISKYANLDMIRTIDRQEGWVVCSISDVDIYNRILVELFDPITMRSLNKSLISAYPQIFDKYSKQH